MGEITVAGFGVLGVIGVGLLLLGVIRRIRRLIVAGAALLLGLAGAWLFGLPGAMAGLIPLAFAGRGSGGAPAGRGGPGRGI